MKDDIYQDLALAREVKLKFGLDVEIRHAILRAIPVSRTADATVFLTGKKQLFVYINAKSNLLLGDVMKIISRMGLKAESFLPPIGDSDYFNAMGKEKFCQVFPGRNPANQEDIRFYKTLAPYNPALVLISKVKNGEIYQFDSDSRAGWCRATKFAYKRIRAI